MEWCASERWVNPSVSSTVRHTKRRDEELREVTTLPHFNIAVAALHNVTILFRLPLSNNCCIQLYLF